MCRVHIDRGRGFRIDPTVENPAAGKHEGVRNVPLDHIEFEIADLGHASVPGRLRGAGLARWPKRRAGQLNRRNATDDIEQIHAQ